MSTGLPDSGGLRHRSRATFEPIPIVPVEVDAGRVAHSAVTGTRRVWVEVLRDGRVIGVTEATADTALDEARALAAALPVRAGTASIGTAALPRVTVVVPTICTRPDGLRGTVEALLASDYDDVEIIVVDNRAAGGLSARELGDDPRIRVLHEPRPGISAARNCGASEATGDVVAFTDDDAVVDRGWLGALGSRFASDPAIEAVGGLVLPLQLETRAQLWFEEYYGGFSRSFDAETINLDEATGDGLFPYAPGRYGAGCNMAIRRTTLERVGGFDVELGVGTPAKGGEDLAMFMGLVLDHRTIAFEPAAIVRHSHRRTDTEFFRQVRSYGTGLAAMYTSLVVHDPRHVARIARRIPAAVRLLARPRADRSPSNAPSYPRRTILHQLCGIAYGPFAFARSAASSRRAP